MFIQLLIILCSECLQGRYQFNQNVLFPTTPALSHSLQILTNAHTILKTIRQTSLSASDSITLHKLQHENLIALQLNFQHLIPNLLMSKQLNASCPTIFVTIPVSVSNTGSISSYYILLSFLSGNLGPTPYPNKSLVAYQYLHNIE
jgi:hypothetical protein